MCTFNLENVRKIRKISVSLLILLFFANAGCQDELNFSTGSSEEFVGELIYADFLIARPPGDTELLQEHTEMELQLNMRTLDTRPGTVNTSDGLFNNVELVMLPEITCDRLSALEIPGNFIRSFIFLAPTSASELGGTDAVLFVSLGQQDSVEVRVLAGSGGSNRIFGVFSLDRVRVEEETP